MLRIGAKNFVHPNQKRIPNVSLKANKENFVLFG